MTHMLLALSESYALSLKLFQGCTNMCGNTPCLLTQEQLTGLLLCSRSFRKVLGSRLVIPNMSPQFGVAPDLETISQICCLPFCLQRSPKRSAAALGTLAFNCNCHGMGHGCALTLTVRLQVTRLHRPLMSLGWTILQFC